MYEPISRKELASGVAELDRGGEHPPELDRCLADRGGEQPPELDPRLEDRGLILTQNILRR